MTSDVRKYLNVKGIFAAFRWDCLIRLTGYDIQTHSNITEQNLSPMLPPGCRPYGPEAGPGLLACRWLEIRHITF